MDGTRTNLLMPDDDIVQARRDATVSIGAAMDYAGGFPSTRVTAQAFDEASAKFKGIASSKLGADFTGDSRADDASLFQQTSGTMVRDDSTFKFQDGSGLTPIDMATVKRGANLSRSRVEDADMFASSNVGNLPTFRWGNGDGITSTEEEDGPLTTMVTRPDDSSLFQSLAPQKTRNQFDWGDDTSPVGLQQLPLGTLGTAPSAPPPIPPKVAAFAPRITLAESTVDAVDAMLNNRGVYSHNGVVDFANALMRLTETEDHERPRATTFKGRQNLDLSLRYHPLGLEGKSDVWAYPKAGFFQGLPVGAIISSNMEYIPQGDQLSALLHHDNQNKTQSEWLEDMYKRGRKGTPLPAMDPPPLLDSAIVPTGSTLNSDDNFNRLRMYNEYDDKEQANIALHHATLHNRV